MQYEAVVIRSREGEKREGQGLLNAVSWERIWARLYTPRVYGTREAGTIVIISSGMSNAAVRDIRESSRGKIRLAKTQSAKLRPGCVYSRHPCPGQRRTKMAPAHDEITRRVLLTRCSQLATK